MKEITVEVTVRIMTKHEAEATDARIIGYSDHLFRSGDNLSDSPSISAV